MTGGLARSYLYVPANEPAKLAKAVGRGSDALIIDLEDAVPLNNKDAAREAVLSWLATSQHDREIQLWVRVNSGELRHTDVKAFASNTAVTGLVLAKTRDADDVHQVAAQLTGAGDTNTKVMPLLETAAAVMDAAAIAKAPRVHQLQIGEVDLTGELGMEPSEDEFELVGIRSSVVVASAAAGIEPAVGSVSRLTSDGSVFQASTARFKRLGFFGRAVIHPRQIEIVHRFFTPSQADVDGAQALLSAFDDEVQLGTGVFLDADGHLVDAAVLVSARRLVAIHERIVNS